MDRGRAGAADNPHSYIDVRIFADSRYAAVWLTPDDGSWFVKLSLEGEALRIVSDCSGLWRRDPGPVFELIEEAYRELEVPTRIDRVSRHVPHGAGDGQIADWVMVLTAALGAGGAGTVLVTALHRVIDRHKAKEVIFHDFGEVMSLEGYPVDDVERIVHAVHLAQTKHVEAARERSALEAAAAKAEAATKAEAEATQRARQEAEANCPAARIKCCLCSTWLTSEGNRKPGYGYLLDEEWQRRFPHMVGILACRGCVEDTHKWICRNTAGGAFLDPAHLATELSRERWDYTSKDHALIRDITWLVVAHPQTALLQGAEDYLRHFARLPDTPDSRRDTERVSDALERWDTDQVLPPD